MKRTDYWLSALLLIVVSVFEQNAGAATCTSILSSNWGNPNTWNCGHVPLSTDTVVIASGFTVRLNNNYTVAALTINAGGTINDRGNNLTVSGNMTVNGTFGVVGGGGSLIANGTNVTISGTGNFVDSVLEISNSATITSGSTLNFSAGGMIDVGPAAPPPNTVTLNIAGAVTGTGQTAGNTILNGNGFSSINITGSINAPVSDITLVAGDVLTNSGAVSVQTLTTDPGVPWTQGANSSLTLSGSTAGFLGTLNASATGNTVNYSGAVQSVIRPSGVPATYYNLSLSGSGTATMPATAMTVAGNFTMSGTVSTTAAAALTVGGSFGIGASNTFANSTFALNVAGNFAQNGTFTAGTGMVTLNGGAAVQAISGTGALGFAKLTVSNTGGITLARNVTVTSAILGAVTLTSTCPIDYTLTSNGGATVQHSCLTIMPGSFNVFETSTAALAITGVIKTKIAGSAFGLDVVAISGGAQASGFNGAVKVELLGNTMTGIALDAKNCPTSFTLLETVTPNPNITGGRSTVNFAAVADAWKDVRVRISYPAATPTVISCATDNFAIRPNSLSVSITDADWQTAGIARALNNSGATGGNVHKAGQPFTLSVTAYNAAATPAITSNYNSSPAVQTIACTLPTPTCINGTLTPGAWAAAGGTVTSTTASYSEAGSFNLTLQDTTFASVDATDGTPATCAGYYVCSAATSVGRFVPDHFTISASNVPKLKTFNNAACAVRSFTYIGQPFGYVIAPQVLVTAQNTSNITTANYTSNLWKLATAAGAQDCTTNLDICTLSSGGVTQTYTYTTSTGALPNWDSTQVALAMPTIFAGSNGTGTVTSASTDLLAFKRSITTPLALFTASITLTDSVKDTSEAGNCGVANCDITTLTPATFSPIAFDAGNEFRYGRLKLSNAHGSELLKLPIPIQTQYWNGTSFVTNTADSCTTLVVNNIKLTTPPAGVSATVGGAFSSGVGSLTLSPPTTAAKAAVDLCVDLGTDPVGGTVCAATTSANLPYLQGLWAPGASYNNDPGARATFGVYKGASEFIYMRENY